MDEIVARIDARKITLAARVPEVMSTIENSFAPLKQKFERELEVIMKGEGSRRHKMIKLQNLVSELRAIGQEHAACKIGCSDCCSQRVMLAQTEADAIGYKIGKPAAQISPNYSLPQIHEFGKTTPCPFLKDESCSIYEHRPFMCRNMLNLDVDSLLCGFENWDLNNKQDPRFTGIPMLGAGPLQDAYMKVAAHDRFGDIRDFFHTGV
jgi:hypothetical protein